MATHRFEPNRPLEPEQGQRAVSLLTPAQFARALRGTEGLTGLGDAQAEREARLSQRVTHRSVDAIELVDREAAAVNPMRGARRGKDNGSRGGRATQRVRRAIQAGRMCGGEGSGEVGNDGR